MTEDTGMWRRVGW